MSHSKYLLLVCLLAGFLVTPALPWVIKKGNVCTVIPHEDGRDDSRSIVRAFRQCNKDASVVFLNRTYNIERVMATHGLQNVTVDIRGTLLVPCQLPRMHISANHSQMGSGAQIRRIGSTPSFPWAT